jgi:hypothetical protein
MQKCQWQRGRRERPKCAIVLAPLPRGNLVSIDIYNWCCCGRNGSWDDESGAGVGAGDGNDAWDRDSWGRGGTWRCVFTL